MTSRDTVIVYVPGYRGTRGGVSVTGEFKTQLKLYLHRTQRADLSFVENASIASLPAIRLALHDSDGPRRVDIVETDWESVAIKLSTTPLLTRIWEGLILLARAAYYGFRSLESPGYSLAAAFGLAILIAWDYLALSSGMAALQKLLPWLDSRSDILTWVDQTNLIYRSAIANLVDGVRIILEPESHVYFLAASVIVFASLLNINAAGLVDVTDIVVRYMDGKRSIGSMTVSMRDEVIEKIWAATETARCGDYGRVILLGHSFGAMIAMEVASRFDDVELVTVGSFFGYLEALNREKMTTAFDDAIQKVKLWHDLYSQDDAYANGRAYRGSGRNVNPANYFPEQVVLKPVSFKEYLSGQSHVLYFRTQELFAILVDDSKHEIDGAPARRG